MPYPLRYALLLLALLSLPGCSEKTTDPSLETTPASTATTHTPATNLLLVCIDTVRADAFYSLGNSGNDALTEWQDRALVYTNASSTSSWTVPAFGSVFTGLWPSVHAAGRFENVVAELSVRPPPLPAGKDVLFLAQAAQESGRHTASFSASPWTNLRVISLGLLRGFDEVVKYELKELDLLAPAMTDDLLQSLDRHSGDKGGVYLLHLMEAHEWHTRSEASLDAHLDALSEQQRDLLASFDPSGTCDDQDSLLCKRFLVYLSAVRAQRAAIANLLEGLKAINALEDTVVVVFSDHGEEFGEHADVARAPKRRDGFSKSYPYEYGHGGTMYQQLLHVPLLVWHPDYQGAVVEQPVSLVDIAPSAARWINLRFKPEQWPGQYLDEVLDTSAVAQDRVLYASGIAYGEQQISVRRGQQKSIWYAASKDNDFFDLETDPAELQPLGAPPWALRFDGLLVDYIDSIRAPEAQPGTFSDQQIQRLQSIGYLQNVDADESDDSNDPDDNGEAPVEPDEQAPVDSVSP